LTVDHLISSGYQDTAAFTWSPARYTLHMQSRSMTVKEYLAELPADRRAAIQAVRSVILKNLDKGYAEGMLYSMIGYFVPHELFPQGYHCDPSKPLCFAGLASQKNYMSLYLMCVYGSKEHESWFRAQWKSTGKKLDMGKACIRFKSADDLALDVIGQAIKRVPAKTYIELYLAGLPASARKSPAKRAVKGTAKPAGKKKTKRSGN
jgi:hypothetical protein